MKGCNFAHPIKSRRTHLLYYFIMTSDSTLQVSLIRRHRARFILLHIVVKFKLKNNNKKSWGWCSRLKGFHGDRVPECLSAARLPARISSKRHLSKESGGHWRVFLVSWRSQKIEGKKQNLTRALIHIKLNAKGENKLRVGNDAWAVEQMLEAKRANLIYVSAQKSVPPKTETSLWSTSLQCRPLREEVFVKPDHLYTLFLLYRPHTLHRCIKRCITSWNQQILAHCLQPPAKIWCIFFHIVYISRAA